MDQSTAISATHSSLCEPGVRLQRRKARRKLQAAPAELLGQNQELARSEAALRQALRDLQASHQQLEAAQMHLIQAEKMECIGTLAAGVAHEVKNPLQTILMGVAFLAANLPAGDGTPATVLNDMKDAVKRADAIVRDLLHLSAARQIEMKEHSLNQVLEHSLCFVNYDLTRARVLVVRDFSPCQPVVRLDKQKMEQVFINLFMNAIQAMPSGGTLFLRTCPSIWPCEVTVEGATQHRFQPGDPVVRIEIEDTGSGIAKEKLPRIFEPFFTTKPNGAGTGLGLPVSKQIVDLHGGIISIGAAPKGGTLVTIILKAESATHSL